MGRMTGFIKKNWEFISYFAFGAIVTIVNFGSYALCADVFHLSEIVSQIISVSCAMVTAFVTNKLFVFHSHKNSVYALLVEILLFFTARIASVIFELVAFSVGVKVFHFNDYITKVSVSTIVVIANYIMSKLLIFKKPSKKDNLSDE